MAIESQKRTKFVAFGMTFIKPTSTINMEKSIESLVKELHMAYQVSCSIESTQVHKMYSKL